MQPKEGREFSQTLLFLFLLLHADRDYFLACPFLFFFLVFFLFIIFFLCSNLSFSRCTLDAQIMPNFIESRSDATDSKVLHTSFPAFKFPDKANLHIQCTLVICNTTCPKFACDEDTFSKHRPKRSIATLLLPNSRIKKLIRMDSHPDTGMQSFPKPISTTSNPILSEVGIVSAVGVKGDEADYEDTRLLFGPMQDEEEAKTDHCFTSPLILLVFVILFASLLASLTLAICMTVKVKALSHRLSGYEHECHVTSRKAFYPHHANNYIPGVGYGRMLDLASK